MHKQRFNNALLNRILLCPNRENKRSFCADFYEEESIPYGQYLYASLAFSIYRIAVIS